MGLNALARQIRACRKCGLWKSRKKAVPGEGPANARLMLVGEAPGRLEDLAGRPFVGASGRFLTQSLAGLGIDRRKVFITGAVKCRPPGNRRPSRQEIEACKPYLAEQIRLIGPKKILLMGDVATKAVLGRGYSVSRHHGRRIRRAGTTCVVTSHPAAAMRFPRMKRIFLRGMKALGK